MGIVFYELIFPLANTFFEVLVTKLEASKAKSALEITQLNAKIQKINEPEENTHVIGFQSFSKSDYEEEEEEDDDE